MMRKSLFFALILLSWMGWQGCNDDLVITADPVDIPVVSGLLSTSDTAHYIRLERAFLDPATSAFEIAKRPDSIYYPEAQVSLRILSTSREYQLERVDAAQEGFERASGIFASEPNYMYKIGSADIPLKEGDEVELIILRNENADLVTATTEMIDKPEIQRPQLNSKLNLIPGRDFKFLWLGNTNAAMFDVNVRVHISERENGSSVAQPRTLNWEVTRNFQSNDLEINGDQFYSFLAGQLDPENKSRTIDSIDVEIAAGGEELLQLLRILQANTGITGTQEIPTYTNMSEGLGIFSSINRSLQTGHLLTDQALDSLRNNSLTQDLGF